ncbi:MAG TPA: hypothetical protein VGQ46_17710 [Thermoanaerobaculia bacterium]|nr:hypothetical protein [Thermoanaerobaculia bacterium]
MTTGLYAAAAVILMTVKLWGATALYRLRRSQSRFFFAAVLLNLPLTIFDIYGRPRGYQMSSIVSMFVGVLIAAGSCVYALYLERVGTLQ